MPHIWHTHVIQDLFTSGAEDEIFKVSVGIPRMIKRICEKTLMYAYQQQKWLIDEHMVHFVSEHEMLKGGGVKGMEIPFKAYTAAYPSRKWEGRLSENP